MTKPKVADRTQSTEVWVVSDADGFRHSAHFVERTARRTAAERGGTCERYVPALKPRKAPKNG